MSLVSLLVAMGGLLVAVLGYFFNSRAIHQEQADRAAAIDAGWASEWAAQRPVVYPLALPDWVYSTAGTRYEGQNSRLLPLKNGGRGLALNVEGRLQAVSPDGTSYDREILAGTIAAGDLLDSRLAPPPGVDNWIGAHGVIEYADLAGNRWETRFEVAEGAGGEIVISAHEPTVIPKVPAADE